MERFITPSSREEIDVDAQVVFIGGPIQGADDWQSRAIDYLTTSNEKLIVASPRTLDMGKNIPYEVQVDWETRYLNRASETGAILFYLAKERKHLCDRAYAQTSRFELGEWKVRHERDNVKVVVGIEPGFSNERYIRRRLSQDCPDVPVFDDLYETCQEVIKLLE